ncbi:MAG: hypothetical protein EAY75_09570 [Bacteroidetes bacterium]|nr:MAG: hypothetical protein EAY75_09570 [Bacteroidota bacterium]
MRIFFCFLLLGFAWNNAFCQSGRLDNSFNGNGVLVRNFTNSTMEIGGVLALSGNRVLAFGTASDSATGTYCFMIRYT